MTLAPITVETDNGTLEFTPSGELAAILERQTPADRQKLIDHITYRLSGDIRDLVRFSFATQEVIDSVLDPDDDPGAFIGLAIASEQGVTLPEINFGPPSSSPMVQNSFTLR